MADQRKQYRVPLGDRGSTIMLLTEEHQKRSYPDATLIDRTPTPDHHAGSAEDGKAAPQPDNKAAPAPQNKSGQ